MITKVTDLKYNFKKNRKQVYFSLIYYIKKNRKINATLNLKIKIKEMKYFKNLQRLVIKMLTLNYYDIIYYVYYINH